jgi:hypothetical protein
VNPNQFQVRLITGTGNGGGGGGWGCLPWMILGVLFLAVLPNWLANGLLLGLTLLIVAPIVALGVLGWWVRRNFIQGSCPACQYPLNGWKFQSAPTQCPQCGEVLHIQEGRYQRMTPPGTVEVQGVEILED